MVAYTSPDCLPYFECTDSPCLNTGTVCEPSTIWCDLVDEVDLILTGFDSTVGRTASAVPFAKVARSAEQTHQMNITLFTRVFWDTVLADNANMVDLDADNVFVKINRPGIWWVELYVAGIPNASNFNELASHIVQRGPTVATFPGTSLSEASGQWRQNLISVQPNTTQNRLAIAFQVTEADLATNSTIDIGAVVGATGTVPTSSFITISYAEMTVYWTAESTV